MDRNTTLREYKIILCYSHSGDIYIIYSSKGDSKHGDRHHLQLKQ